jgi:hypothetical protein
MAKDSILLGEMAARGATMIDIAAGAATDTDASQ